MEKHEEREEREELTVYLAQYNDSCLSVYDVIEGAQVFYAKTDEEFFEATFTAAWTGRFEDPGASVCMDIRRGWILLFKIDGGEVVSLQEKYVQYARSRGITDAMITMYEKQQAARED